MYQKMSTFKKPKKLDDDELMEDKYFDEETGSHQKDQIEDEVDPLDLYMKNLETTGKESDKRKTSTTSAADSKAKTAPQKEERMIADDPLESYMDSIKKKIITEQNKKGNQGGNKATTNEAEDSEEELLKAMEQEGQKNYDFIDSDGELDYEALRNVKKQKIEELAALDHSQIKYESFRRDFYVEHPAMKELDAERVSQIRKELEIRVEGKNLPKPVISFAHLKFPEKLMEKIRKQEFEKPTPIQSQVNS